MPYWQECYLRREIQSNEYNEYIDYLRCKIMSNDNLLHQHLQMRYSDYERHQWASEWYKQRLEALVESSVSQLIAIKTESSVQLNYESWGYNSKRRRFDHNGAVKWNISPPSYAWNGRYGYYNSPSDYPQTKITNNMNRKRKAKMNTPRSITAVAPNNMCDKKTNIPPLLPTLNKKRATAPMKTSRVTAPMKTSRATAPMKTSRAPARKSPPLLSTKQIQPSLSKLSAAQVSSTTCTQQVQTTANITPTASLLPTLQLNNDLPKIKYNFSTNSTAIGNNEVMQFTGTIKTNNSLTENLNVPVEKGNSAERLQIKEEVVNDGYNQERNIPSLFATNISPIKKEFNTVAKIEPSDDYMYDELEDHL